MTKAKNIDEFLNSTTRWHDELVKLHQILSAFGMEENIKWGTPVYSIKGKNIVGMTGFKNHFALWFFQGVFLDDPQDRLVNAQEGTTKAQRQMRFNSASEIDEALIRNFVEQAIANALAGKSVKPKPKNIPVAAEFSTALESDASLQNAFAILSPGKQKEYLEYVLEAKQSATRLRRIEKIIPLIMSGKGLNDRYK
ncbi:MAG: hypothetical protein GC181_05115 [Bacteroidetes bacterium]|nr:hypothetical protein [Bacteroidota bacterium]